jgi:hypothetical protein
VPFIWFESRTCRLHSSPEQLISGSGHNRLQDRIQGLLDTVGALREELRGSFKSSEVALANMNVERREWQVRHDRHHSDHVIQDKNDTENYRAIMIF